MRSILDSCKDCFKCCNEASTNAKVHRCCVCSRVEFLSENMCENTARGPSVIDFELGERADKEAIQARSLGFEKLLIAQ